MEYKLDKLHGDIRHFLFIKFYARSIFFIQSQNVESEIGGERPPRIMSKIALTTFKKRQAFKSSFHFEGKKSELGGLLVDFFCSDLAVSFTSKDEACYSFQNFSR